ncbi:MAG TPA: DALR anticodon-binding domain-containing protein [Steroidobacteraceae bacterium]|nr:DALR anticodon-binding domain-containing protein [Steroidobacteraceae bacterium]
MLAALGRLPFGMLPDAPTPEAVVVERSRDAQHGDFATNVAMRLAKAARRDPRELAQEIIAALPANPLIERAEAAGAGFINFFLARNAYAHELSAVHELGERYGRSNLGRGERVVVEIVAVNPTSTLHRGRQAAYGVAVANLLSAIGFEVLREEYAETDDCLEFHFVQSVNLCRGGERLAAGTREMPSVTLQQVRQEAGDDVCRFLYLMRGPDQPLDFDLELAKVRSNDNPAYFTQYAHARVASVMKELRTRELRFDCAEGLAHVGLLTSGHERAALSSLARYPEALELAATQRAPHALTQYLRDLANTLHTYHNAEQFIVSDAKLRNARLALLLGLQQVLRNGLTLLGVSAPETM